MHHFAAVFDQRAADADLDDRQFAKLRNGLQGVDRFVLAREGDRFVLVGEDDVHVFFDQGAQEIEVLLDDVETRQVDRHLQSAFFGRPGRVLDQFVVLHQVPLDVDAVESFEDVGADVGRRQFERGARCVIIVRSPSGEISATHLPDPLAAAEDEGLHTEVRERLLEEVAVVSGPTLPMNPVPQPRRAMARIVLPAEPPSESE